HHGLSFLGFFSNDLIVGVGTAPLDWKETGSYEETGKKAIEAALKDAGKTASETPQLLFFAGLNLITDIDIFHGIQKVIGEVPICGGNTGQNTGELIPGDGYVISNDNAAGNLISVAAIWTKTK